MRGALRLGNDRIAGEKKSYRGERKTPRAFRRAAFLDHLVEAQRERERQKNERANQYREDDIAACMRHRLYRLYRLYRRRRFWLRRFWLRLRRLRLRLARARALRLGGFGRAVRWIRWIRHRESEQRLRELSGRRRIHQHERRRKRDAELKLEARGEAHRGERIHRPGLDQLRRRRDALQRRRRHEARQTRLHVFYARANAFFPRQQTQGFPGTRNTANARRAVCRDVGDGRDAENLAEVAGVVRAVLVVLRRQKINIVVHPRFASTKKPLQKQPTRLVAAFLSAARFRNRPGANQHHVAPTNAQAVDGQHDAPNVIEQRGEIGGSA